MCRKSMKSHAFLPILTIHSPHPCRVEFVLRLPNRGFWARNCSYPYLIFSLWVRNWSSWQGFLPIWWIISRCLWDSELIPPLTYRRMRIVMGVIVARAWLVLTFKLLFIFFRECLLAFNSTHTLHVVRNWGCWTPESSSRNAPLRAKFLSTIWSQIVESSFVFCF